MLTPMMATRSMRLVKPEGWSLAYWGAMVSGYLVEIFECIEVLKICLMELMI